MIATPLKIFLFCRIPLAIAISPHFIWYDNLLEFKVVEGEIETVAIVPSFNFKSKESSVTNVIIPVIDVEGLFEEFFVQESLVELYILVFLIFF